MKSDDVWGKQRWKKNMALIYHFLAEPSNGDFYLSLTWLIDWYTA
jgi:hypothetical protein